jgi:hypothetical protein
MARTASMKLLSTALPELALENRINMKKAQKRNRFRMSSPRNYNDIIIRIISAD